MGILRILTRFNEKSKRMGELKNKYTKLNIF